MGPTLKQYREAKARHPGLILLFRVGDFYEAFDEDAELCSRVLGLTLTHCDKASPMTGFPANSLDHHLRSLLTAGHRVAICEQVDEEIKSINDPIDAREGNLTLF